MDSNSDFESQSFNRFPVNDELQNNELGRDVNYYLHQVSLLDTIYYVPAGAELIKFFKSIQFI